jgi:tetratricopeptide (TPR) repeat protein
MASMIAESWIRWVRFQPSEYAWVGLFHNIKNTLTYTGAINIVQLLAKLDDLPEQVRFLATTRTDPRVLKFFPSAPTTDLFDNAPNVDDVYSYVFEHLSTREVANCQKLAQKIAHAAGGVFLYANLVLSGLLLYRPRTCDWQALALPDGLSGIYHEFLNRELGVNEENWYKVFRPTLGLLAVAQGEGLELGQLQKVMGAEGIVEHALRISAQYLRGRMPDGPFRLFHKSFEDFLLEDASNIDYHIESAEMHTLLADHYLSSRSDEAGVNWNRIDDYSISYLAKHLYYLQHDKSRRQALYTLISKPWLENKRHRFASDQPFADDVALAIAAAKAEEPPNIAEVVRNCLICATLGSTMTGVPPVVLGTLARVGKVNEALSHAQLMRGEQKSSAYCQIGDALRARGNVAHADQIMQQGIDMALADPDSRTKSELLCQFALAYLRKGIRDRAAELVNIAWDAIQGSDSGMILFGHPELIPAMVQAGDAELINRILRFITGIENEELRSALLYRLSDVSGVKYDAQQQNEMLVAAEGLVHTQWRVHALSAVSKVTANAGHVDKAAMLAKQAILAIDQVKDPVLSMGYLSHVIPVLALTRQLDLAMTLVDRIEEGHTTEESISWAKRDSADALYGLAENLAQTGSKNEYLQILVLLADRLRYIFPDLRIYYQCNCVRHLMNFGDITRALALTNLVASTVSEIQPHANDRNRALKRLSHCFTELRQFEEALRTARTISDDVLKAAALGEVAETLAADGDEARAAEVLAYILEKSKPLEDNQLKSKTLCAFSSALGQIGMKDKALEVAEIALHASLLIRDNFSRDYILSDIVCAFTQAGDYALSSSTLDRMTIPELKLIALKNIAHVISRTPPDTSAISLAVWLLSSLECTANSPEMGSMIILEPQVNKYELAKMEALGAVAEWLINAGMPIAGIEISRMIFGACDSFGPCEEKVSVLCQLVRNVDHLGLKSCTRVGLAGAVTIAEAIEGDKLRARALCKVLQLAIEIGDRGKAMEIADRVLNIAREIENNWEKSCTLSEVAESMAILANRSKFDEIAQTMITSFNEDSLLPIRVQEKLIRSLKLFGEERMVSEGMKEILPAVCQTLDWARYRSRESVFTMLQESAHAIASMDQGVTLCHIVQQWHDVECWWGSWRERIPF